MKILYCIPRDKSILDEYIDKYFSSHKEEIEEFVYQNKTEEDKANREKYIKKLIYKLTSKDLDLSLPSFTPISFPW